MAVRARGQRRRGIFVDGRDSEGGGRREGASPVPRLAQTLPVTRTLPITREHQRGQASSIMTTSRYQLPRGGNDSSDMDGRGGGGAAGFGAAAGTTISNGSSHANNSSVLFQAASVTSSSVTPFSLAITQATPPITHGSFRPLSIFPS